MSSSDVDQIKERLGIADVVGSYIQLQKAGKNFKARCPFHNEKTPSFLVSPDRGTYHCFGCSKGGDIFSFVEEIEGIDFPGALKVLAERAGVTLSKQNKSDSKERGNLFAVMGAAAKWYEKNLYTKKEVGQYLKDRGLTGETAKKFCIGYAPDQWRALSDYLTTKKFTVDEMEAVGLVTRSPRGHYDRFRGRIMFPIMDSAGRVVAFTGRVFDNREDKTAAKYVNSPETKLYNKSDVLYGFHLAKTAIRKAGSCVLVEGQMDIIMSHQAGVENTIAVSGTALTEYHLKRIERLAEKVIFAFDGDKAGESASDRAIGIALALGLDVQIVALPEGKDPADIVKEGAKSWTDMVAGAQDVIEYKISQIHDTDTPAARKRVQTTVLPYIARLMSTIDQGHYVSRVATLLGVKEDAVWEDLKTVRVDDAVGHTAPPVAEKTAEAAKSRIELIVRRLVGMIEWIREKDLTIDGADDIATRIKNDMPRVVSQAIQQKDTLLYEVELYSNPENDIQKQLDELFRNYKQEYLTHELERVSKQIAQAQQTKDSDTEMQLLERYHELLKQKE